MDDFARIREDAAARVKERADAFEARVERGRQDIRNRIARVQFLQEEARRMQVLFNKGQNMVAAFYAELENLRPQITDELLGDWCFWNLGFSLNGLNRIAKIFDDANADRVRASLKKARLLEQEQAAEERARVAAEKAAQRAAEDEARRQREAEKAAEAAEAERRAALAMTRVQRGHSKVTPALVAQVKARLLAGAPILENETAREFGCTPHVVRAAADQARGEIRAEARHAGIVPEPPKKRRPRRDSRDVLAEVSDDTQRSQPALADGPASGEDPLAKTFHAAYARQSEARRAWRGARSAWIEATLEIASVLRQARERSPTNVAFSTWLKANGIDGKISPHDRAALLGMGGDLTTARAALEKTNSWSWELNWKEINHLANSRKMVNGDLEAPSQALH